MAVRYRTAQESARMIREHHALRREVEARGGDPSTVRLPDQWSERRHKDQESASVAASGDINEEV